MLFFKHGQLIITWIPSNGLFTSNDTIKSGIKNTHVMNIIISTMVLIGSLNSTAIIDTDKISIRIICKNIYQNHRYN